MTDADRDHAQHHESSSFHPPSVVVSAPGAAIFVVSLLAALGAAGAVYGLGDLVGLGVAVAIGVAGAGVAAFAAGKPPAPADAKVNALLEAASAEDAPAEPPARFRHEPWATLYRRTAGYVEAQRSATLAVQEVEHLRSELEQKPADPASFEPRPSYAADELVGSGVTGGADVESAAAARAREAVCDAVTPISQGLASIESELRPLLELLQSAGSDPEGAPNGHPAKMVDALVRTAADGIEDLAAGLMRANELATVAERVTNRATLLALNAALEATRSGSEAFASIAEETRRLAEYAREATDTISRLSNEIEMKVGETIGSIQSSSEDAKAAVDSIRVGGGTSRAVAPQTIQALESLLGRVRELRERADAAATPPAASLSSPARETSAVESDTPYSPPVEDRAPYAPPVESDAPYAPPVENRAPYVPPTSGDSPSLQDSEPAPSYVTLDASSSDEPVAPEAPGDSHDSFGARPIQEGDAPPPVEAVSDEPAVNEEASAAEATPSGEMSKPHPGDPAVVAKIPDWLEGIGPGDHR
jgi:hypothetical protein